MGFLRSAAVLSLLLINSDAFAQQPRLPTPDLSQVGDARPTSCAVRSAVIDGIRYNALADELIIIIARSGDGEMRADLGRRRLHNVRAYWTEFLPAGSRRRPETIVLAEGERVRGFGRLEFYTGGKLIEVIRLKRNADLFTGECYPPDDSYIRNNRFNPCEVRSNRIFYPCRDAKPRQRKRRR